MVAIESLAFTGAFYI